ncbi:CRISPR-associated helicase Cas3' [Chitinophaga sp. 30R24]|uniref:CRISPR-associated helicase Cas3' n=1 Tax=Chitinophaga sp. 30R24 TaxID=3248838 RepID=UPI003B8FB8C2
MNNAIIFYSHSKESTSGQTGSKRLTVHNQGVTGKAIKNLYAGLGFSFSIQTLENLLDDLCQYHDLGKYTIFFQDYLLKRGKPNQELKKHSRIGAYAVHEKYKEKSPILAAFSYFIIVSHHSNLTEIIDCLKKEKDKESIFNTQRDSLLPHLEQIKDELSSPALHQLLSFPDFKKCRNEIRNLRESGKASIEHYFLINYLFSLLIEADKLDASDTPVYQRQAITSDLVDQRLHSSTNVLRNQVRKTVIAKLNKPDILQHKIFTLTAPTGVGKTLVALDFALKLREKIHLEEKFLPQIIYGLPFINIIEQALEEYEHTMPDTNILAHYQYADVFNKKENDGESIASDYHQQLMQLDTWQSDVVITSFVQFFQTLIGNRNKLLKKFHHMAGAIVILDEVQTLSLDKIPIIGVCLYHLCKYLGTRILLMTATKPQIFELAYQEILLRENNLDKSDKAFFNNGQPAYLELLDDHKNIYESYRRTAIKPLLDRGIVDEADFISNYFHQHWNNNQSCIIVVNTVNRSIELYEAVKQYLSEKKYDNPIHYLSTNIVPCRRFEVIKQIKEELRANLHPILISTQIVEAGVDLDFDMGFRDIAPIDSIIQVAGRINRQANPLNPERTYLPLYIIDFGDCHLVYGKITYDQSRKALNGKIQIYESEYLELVHNYFNQIADKGGFDYSRKLYQSLKNLEYDNKDHSISTFKIIEEQHNARSVFVEVDECGTIAKEAFLDMLNCSDKEAAKQKKIIFERSHKRVFNQRIITVPSWYTDELRPIHPLAEDILVIDQQLLNIAYDTETGFNRKNRKEIHTILF